MLMQILDFLWRNKRDLAICIYMKSVVAVINMIQNAAFVINIYLFLLDGIL